MSRYSPTSIPNNKIESGDIRRIVLIYRVSFLFFNLLDFDRFSRTKKSHNAKSWSDGYTLEPCNLFNKKRGLR